MSFYNCFMDLQTCTGLDWEVNIFSACALAKASVRRSPRVIEKKLMPTSKKRAEPLVNWPPHLPEPPPPPKLGTLHKLNLLPPPPRPPGNWK